MKTDEEKVLNWKTLLQRMATFKGKSSEEEKDYDPYDMLVKQMGFEKKEARGGERMKTDEEKVKEERERLQSLEEDRQRKKRGMREEKSLRRRVRKKREKMMMTKRTVGMKAEKNLISSQILLSPMKRMNLEMKRTPLTRR